MARNTAKDLLQDPGCCVVHADMPPGLGHEIAAAVPPADLVQLRGPNGVVQVKDDEPRSGAVREKRRQMMRPRGRGARQSVCIRTPLDTAAQGPMHRLASVLACASPSTPPTRTYFHLHPRPPLTPRCVYTTHQPTPPAPHLHQQQQCGSGSLLTPEIGSGSLSSPEIRSGAP